MKSLFTIHLLVFFLSALKAQQFTWVRSVGGVYDDNISTVRIDESGDLITCGNCSGNCSFGAITFADSAAFIAKYDSSGNVTWVIRAGDYSAGGTFLPFLYTNLEVSSQNDIYAIGAFADTGIVGDITLVSTEPENMYLAKIDPGGNVIWARKIADHADGMDIDLDQNNNIVVTGQMRDIAHFDSTTFTNYGYPLTPDIFIAKYDSSGTLLWARQAGGIDYDVAYSVSCDNSGNIFIGGELNGDASFDAYTLLVPTHSGFIAKYNASGNAQWANYSGYCSFAVAADLSGNCYTGGYYWGSATFDTIALTYPVSSGIYVAKINSSGNYEWARGSSAYSASSSVTELNVDEFANCYAVGYFQDSLYLDSVHFVQPGPVSITHAAFVLAFTPSGEVAAGTRPMNVTPSDAFATAIDVNNCNIAFAGVFRDTPPAIYFDSDSLLSNGMHDLFISRINSCLATLAEDERAISPNQPEIFPNPSEGIFTIAIPGALNEISLTIYNAFGEKIFQEYISASSQTKINLTNIPQGIYFVTVDDGQKRNTGKVIIE